GLGVYVANTTSMMARRRVGVNQEIADTVVVMALRVVTPLRRQVKSLGRICFDPRRHHLASGQPCVEEQSLRARRFAQCREIEKRLQLPPDAVAWNGAGISQERSECAMPHHRFILYSLAEPVDQV